MGLDIFGKHDNIKADILHNKNLIISTNKRITALADRINTLEKRVFIDTMSKEELLEYIETEMNPIQENLVKEVQKNNSNMMNPVFEISEPIALPEMLSNKRIFHQWTEKEDNALMKIMNQNTHKNNIQIAREVHKDFKRSLAATANRISILNKRNNNDA